MNACDVESRLMPIHISMNSSDQKTAGFWDQGDTLLRLHW